jgi:hypothetical protein
MEFYHDVKEAELCIKGNIEKEYTHNRQILEDVVGSEVLQKLEKIRRSK